MILPSGGRVCFISHDPIWFVPPSQCHNPMAQLGFILGRYEVYKKKKKVAFLNYFWFAYPAFPAIDVVGPTEEWGEEWHFNDVWLKKYTIPPLHCIRCLENMKLNLKKKKQLGGRWSRRWSHRDHGQISIGEKGVYFCSGLLNDKRGRGKKTDDENGLVSCASAGRSAVRVSTRSRRRKKSIRRSLSIRVYGGSDVNRTCFLSLCFPLSRATATTAVYTVGTTRGQKKKK